MADAVATRNGNGVAPPQAVPFRRGSMLKEGQLETLPFSAGNQSTSELVSAGFIERILLPGTFAITETTMATPHEDNPHRLLNRIRLRDSSGGVVYSLSGYNSFLHNKFFSGARAWVDQSADTQIYVGTAFDNGVAPRSIWQIPVTINERDSIGLLMNQSDRFKYVLEIDWATMAQLATTPGDMVITGSIVPHYRYMTVPAPTAPNGAVQLGPPFPRVVHQVIDRVGIGMGTAPSTYTLNLTVGKIYRGLILVTRDANVRENAITAVRVIVGDEIHRWTASGQELRGEQYIANGRDMPVGVYLIDFSKDSGLWSGLDFQRDYLDTRNLAQFKVEIDLTGIAGAGTLDVISDMLIVPGGITL